MTMMLRSRVRRPTDPRRPSPATVEFARRLCRCHSAPLLAMATLILGDVDAAAEIVVDTLAAASRSRRPRHPGGRRMRARLATSVYRRCLGRLALRERFPRSTEGPAPGGPVGLARLTEGQRCVIAFTVFSGHGLPGVARTLNLTPARVLHLVDEVRTMTERPGTSIVDVPAVRLPVSRLL